MLRSFLLPTLMGCALLWRCRFVVASEESAEEGSPLLTEDSFANVIKEKPHFVMFFAPWCGHCKKLAPVWQELHELLGGYTDAPKGGNDDPTLLRDVGVARVDCTKQTALCSQHQVTGYPTLKFFKQPEVSVRYKGAREIDDLLTFMKKELGIIKDLEESPKNEPSEVSVPVGYTSGSFDAAIASGHHFVKFFAPWCGHCQRLAPVWDKLAAELSAIKQITIAKVDCTEHKDLCTRHGVRGYPTLLWFTDGEQVGEKYAGDRSLEALRTFALEQAQKPSKPIATSEDTETKDSESTPSPPPPKTAVLSLSQGTFDSTITKGVTLVKFFAPWCGHCKKMAGAYEQLGALFDGHQTITIAEVDCTEQENRELCSQHEVKGFPTVLLYRSGSRVASYEGDRSTSDMADFVTSHMSHDEL